MGIYIGDVLNIVPNCDPSADYIGCESHWLATQKATCIGKRGLSGVERYQTLYTFQTEAGHIIRAYDWDFEPQQRYYSGFYKVELVHYQVTIILEGDLSPSRYLHTCEPKFSTLEEAEVYAESRLKLLNVHNQYTIEEVRQS